MTTRFPFLNVWFVAALATACSSADDGSAVCGDGTIGGVEQCDDGNGAGGDGCSPACKVEANVSCGDGAVSSTEGCDDGNAAAGDGCSITCMVEAGFTCTGAPSTCTNGGGGTCSAPFVITLTDNMGTLEGTAMGDTTMSTDQIAEATCDGFDSGAGPDHVWKFTLTDTRDVMIATDENSSFDTVLRVMTAPCDVTTEITEFGDADGCSDGEGASEFLGYVALPPGTYYVALDGYTAEDKGTYTFNIAAVRTTCGDGVLDLLEFCDDGNSAAADGCDGKCEVEDGYTCEGEPSSCSTGGGGSGVQPGDLVINEYMAADNMSDTNCDGMTTGTADEFIELVNVTANPLDLTGLTISDSVTLRHTFGATTLAPGMSIVVWNAGSPACAGVTSFAVASSGQLGLNDDGDTITVATGGTSPVTIATVTYASATANVSSNLSPDVTGTSYALHNALTGAVGNYSPGKRANGTTF